ncbi:hypothetical protein LCGC14_2519950, partial [marine sediment metagenome]
IAPGHGTDDYYVGLENNLNIYCPVQADGTFDDTAPRLVRGKSVWEANDLITEHLKQIGSLLASETITHSYPHDWRSKTPVIFRATEQWFISVDRPLAGPDASLREMAMDVCRRDIDDGGVNANSDYVTKAELLINGKPAQLDRPDDVTCSFRLPLTSESAGRWRLTLTDRYGHHSKLIEHTIEVIPDTPPTARITGPAVPPEKVRPTDKVPLALEISDDFGIARAELLVSVDDRKVQTIAIPVPAPASGPATRRAGPIGYLNTIATAELASLDLAGGRSVSLQIRALDNLPASLGGPQEGLSERLTFELDVKAPTYVFQVQLAMDLQIREALERIYAELISGKKISGPLRRSMKATKTLTETTLGKVDALRAHLVAAEDLARNLADATAGGQYPKLSEAMTKLADKHVGKARELTGLIKITDAQKPRAELADEADFQIDRAIAIVSKLLKDFDVWTEQARMAVMHKMVLAIWRVLTTREPFDRLHNCPELR